MTNKELQDLDNQWKDMNHYLSLNLPSGHKHDYILDRLVWLKKRMNACKESANYTAILYYFNETVFFFNQELNLNDKTRFKEK